MDPAVGFAWRDLLLAVGLVLAVEGVLYAAFPETMRRTLRAMLQVEPDRMRRAALVFAVLGVALAWLARAS